jgi:hypothetical protein
LIEVWAIFSYSIIFLDKLIMLLYYISRIRSLLFYEKNVQPINLIPKIVELINLGLHVINILKWSTWIHQPPQSSRIPYICRQKKR